MRLTIRNDEPDSIITTPHGDIASGEEQTFEYMGRTSLYLAMRDDDAGKTASFVNVVAPDAPPEHIAQFFAFEHLPPHLCEVSRPFWKMAQAIVENLPRNPERTVALRKLLEAKDAAVRALVAK